MKFERDRYFLQMALEEAEMALKENTYPVGAVIVDGNNNVIARGRNRVHPQKDITAHAEIDAIRNAGEAMFDAKIKMRSLLFIARWNRVQCVQGVFYSQKYRE